MTPLDAALDYARRGWKVHPLKPREKLPLSVHGHKDATDDETAIRAWWDSTPEANIGISCEASGLVVLDVDPRHDGVRPAGLPRTVEALTGGGGLHLLFRHPGLGVRLRGQLAQGVDVKAKGYIVAGPSVHPSGALYRWAPGLGPDEVELAELPPALLAALTETRPPPEPKAVRSATALDSFEQAVEAYNYEHARDFGSGRSECPVCQVGRNSGGHGFGAGKGEGRWSCFSTSHSGAGVKSEECWTGDVLDLDAYAERCTTKELLVRRGYLKAQQWSRPPLATREQVLEQARAMSGATRVTPTGNVVAAVAAEREEEPEAMPSASAKGPIGKDLTSLRRLLSPSSACSAAILGGRTLTRNEMTAAVELDGKPVEEQDLTSIRLGLERFAKTKKGKPIQWPKGDVADVLGFIASLTTVHPVREWLRSLTWDGVDRPKRLLPEALGQARDSIQATMLRRWLISAVARAMKPGCKVDSMLILAGKQGALKSTFFSALGGKWFTDSPIDVGNKDGPLVMSRAWIVEWAELDSMRKARDAEALKAFLASPSDTFRPPYERTTIVLPRSSVIVGSTNSSEFLSDDTGSRRFWVVPTDAVDVTWVRLNRDQLWAQAVALYDSGEQWWLTPEEDALRATASAAHEVKDAWHGVVSQWLNVNRCVDSVSIDDVLVGAIEKPVGQWGHYEKVRVGRILGALGWGWTRTGSDGLRERRYVRPREAD